jgi:hypothetical protein
VSTRFHRHATVGGVPRSPAPGDFDPQSLFDALDRQRQERGLSWTGVARELWSMSAELNALRPSDHPLAPVTITNVARNGDTSCQHALFFLRWLGRTPESFMPDAECADVPLPEAGPDRRLRWHLAGPTASPGKRLRVSCTARRTSSRVCVRPGTRPRCGWR